MSKSAYLSTQALPTVLRWLALAATLFMTAAHADDYAEVNALVRGGQLTQALAKADQYLAAKPRDPQMRFIKGVIQTEAGKPNDAIATFTKITQDYPELPEPYNNLAVLYAGQNQFDKARAALEMAIRTNPSYATAHENLGDVYAKLASQAYSKALQLDGGNSAVPPKLALIRTLFNTEPKAQKPAAATAVPPAVTAQVPAAPAKPAATAPAAAAPAKPAVVAPATPPVAAAPAAPAVTPTPAPAAAATASAAEQDVESAVKAWAGAWAAKDLNAYFAAYGKNFDTPGKQTRRDWEEERRARIVGKSRISVKVSDLLIDVKGSKAIAKFKQDYSADTLNISSRKTLEMAKAGERWLIVRESTGG
ncbi:tetratricopeptide repeat protein [Polaromonas sp.]|uniref:tetratricopeptide repeat protein n=1 Tax=Polaromonas sp. TaxID=1869339 RepID=UPI0032663092